MTSATSNTGRTVSLIVACVFFYLFFDTKFVMCMTVSTRAHWDPFCLCALVCERVCVCVCVCE